MSPEGEESQLLWTNLHLRLRGALPPNRPHVTVSIFLLKSGIKYASQLPRSNLQPSKAVVSNHRLNTVSKYPGRAPNSSSSIHLWPPGTGPTPPQDRCSGSATQGRAECRAFQQPLQKMSPTRTCRYWVSFGGKKHRLHGASAWIQQLSIVETGFMLMKEISCLSPKVVPCLFCSVNITRPVEPHSRTVPPRGTARFRRTLCPGTDAVSRAQEGLLFSPVITNLAQVSIIWNKYFYLKSPQ